MYADLFSLTFGLITDMVFDINLDLYGYYSIGFDWPSICFIILVYASVNSVFLNHFPYENKMWKKIFYVFLWCVFASVYEQAARQTSLFYYNGWKLLYSVLFYPVAYAVLLFNIYI
ncbi:MAG: CBO0543 family protein [Tuberibacillus sp.]